MLGGVLALLILKRSMMQVGRRWSWRKRHGRLWRLVFQHLCSFRLPLLLPLLSLLSAGLLGLSLRIGLSWRRALGTGGASLQGQQIEHDLVRSW